MTVGRLYATLQTAWAAGHAVAQGKLPLAAVRNGRKEAFRCQDI